MKTALEELSAKSLEAEYEGQKDRKQSKGAVRGWRAVYPLSRTRTSARFLATFLANVEVVIEVEEKAPRTKQTTHP